MKTSIKSILATVAPTLATTFGGPLAGMATREIAKSVLGREDASLAEVEAALETADPGILAELKKIDHDFKVNLKNADVKLEKIAADDRASARERQARVKDRTPAILGLAIIAGFFGVLAYLFRYGLPEEGSEVLLIMVGSLGAMTTAVANYFFGSSVGSKSKDAIIADLKGA